METRIEKSQKYESPFGNPMSIVLLILVIIIDFDCYQLNGQVR